jgi:hypothetical protein
LTVPTVPTGINAGVRMVPRGVEISPSRASPSVFLTLKENAEFFVIIAVCGRAASGWEARPHAAVEGRTTIVKKLQLNLLANAVPGLVVGQVSH